MKTKHQVETKLENFEKLTTKTKPKSLRPMRSMVAVRSLKPRAAVATMARPEEITLERH